MVILVLDPRWPDMIPQAALGRIVAPVEFTPEVPVAVRWNFDALVSGVNPDGAGTLVTTDPDVDAAGEVLWAPSLEDPVFKARRVMTAAVSLGEWESAQTHESLLPYLVEEAGEFADAVRAGAGDGELKKELGDVFLQVLFHSEIASRRGGFDLDEVAGSFVAKLRSRAPYLFDGTAEMVGVEEQERLWAAGKRAEREADLAAGGGGEEAQ